MSAKGCDGEIVEVPATLFQNGKQVAVGAVSVEGARVIFSPDPPAKHPPALLAPITMKLTHGGVVLPLQAVREWSGQRDSDCRWDFELAD